MAAWRSSEARRPALRLPRIVHGALPAAASTRSAEAGKKLFPLIDRTSHPMDAIFRVDGNDVVTSPFAAGPWDPSMQHGSPPAALVVWAAERIPTAVTMRVARVTVDLMRPVPVGPLTIESEILRAGRKIQLCAVRLLAKGVVVVGATVLKIKVQANELPPEAAILPVELPGPDHSRVERVDFSSSPFVTGMSLRAGRVRFGSPGPGAIWYRVDRPTVEGSPVSQAMRAMAAADFCNGTSAVLDFRPLTLLKPDLTLNFLRHPVDDWLL